MIRRTVVTIVVAALLCTATDSALAGEPICGDVNASGEVTAGDALLVLQKAVGQSVELECPAPATPLQTGQTTCYKNDSLKNCAGTGQDGELQKGVPRSFADNGDGTITDNATGLTWEKLSKDDSIHDKDRFFTWANAFAVKIAELNADRFAGHNDWRLPNLFELETLLNIDAAKIGPDTFDEFDQNCSAICTVLSCSCIEWSASSLYWSSSTYQKNKLLAWGVNFNDGIVRAADKGTGSAHHVRAVRGGL